jgi:hypothetical protein
VSSTRRIDDSGLPGPEGDKRRRSLTHRRRRAWLRIPCICTLPLSRYCETFLRCLKAADITVRQFRSSARQPCSRIVNLTCLMRDRHPTRIDRPHKVRPNVGRVRGSDDTTPTLVRESSLRPSLIQTRRYPVRDVGIVFRVSSVSPTALDYADTIYAQAPHALKASPF